MRASGWRRSWEPDQFLRRPPGPPSRAAPLLRLPPPARGRRQGEVRGASRGVAAHRALPPLPDARRGGVLHPAPCRGGLGLLAGLRRSHLLRPTEPRPVRPVLVAREFRSGFLQAGHTPRLPCRSLPGLSPRQRARTDRVHTGHGSTFRGTHYRVRVRARLCTCLCVRACV